MKKIKGLKFYTVDEVFGKYRKSATYRRAYDEEMARLRLVRQVREMRISKKMTQKTLAEKVDMSQSVIARIESGTHSFSLGTLQRLAKAFNKKIQFA